MSSDSLIERLTPRAAVVARPSVDNDTAYGTDMFAEMHAALNLQRWAVHGAKTRGEAAPARLTVRDMLELATVRGAWNAALSHKIGTLTPGKDADVIMLRTDTINVMPLNNAAGAVVTLMDTSNVDTVFIAGKLMKRNGQLVGVDLAKIRREVEAARLAVLTRAGVKPNRLGV